MTNKSEQGLILFAHGARDARWAEPFKRLQALVRSERPAVRVELAFLEFMTPGLPEIVPQMVADGVQKITLVPVFLAQGGHVLRDLPQMVANLKEQLPALDITIAQAIGEDDEVMRAIAKYCIASCV
ncbi:MAG: CbiX/SirB N-terminal domain-containing protein [Burkholderiales bacterium]|nr:CbiX/SirB N-terminal domain-containing protein [Burkholderiales bacterium]